ncbi:hypothetical protein EG68_06005 [Paragonimus skrjabini miyazakii]|uniref:Uncharacterized protein n=1 Tax=Paragonimus skrjabini miyazakii TaxID=59628 RepID=A0A8S9YBK2_9TREM|nr:hypothetical protein EG68_06005 [Paragonimus skrjabini miyazakii]
MMMSLKVPFVIVILTFVPDTVDNPKTLEGTVLRDYQQTGYRWIMTLYENGMNGILADEMGLGKTIQVIAALAGLIEAGVCGPFLIVVPLSLLSVWADQLAAFAPRLPTLIYYGSLAERHKLRKRIRRRVRIHMRDPIEQYKSVLSEDISKTGYIQNKSCSREDPSNPRESPPVLHNYESSLEASYHVSSSSESLCSFPSSCSAKRPTNAINRVERSSVSSCTTDPSLLHRLDETISEVLNSTNLSTEVKNVDTMEITDLLASSNDQYCNNIFEGYEETSVYPVPQFSRLPESVESAAVETSNLQCKQDSENSVSYDQGFVAANLPSFSECCVSPGLGSARVKMSNSVHLHLDDHFHESQIHDTSDCDKPHMPTGSCAQTPEHEDNCNSVEKLYSITSGISSRLINTNHNGSILTKLPSPQRFRKQVNVDENSWETMDDDSSDSVRKSGLQLNEPHYDHASIKMAALDNVDRMSTETPSSCVVLKTELINANLDVVLDSRITNDLFDSASPDFRLVRYSDSGSPQTRDPIKSSSCKPYLNKTVNEPVTSFTSVACLDKVRHSVKEVVVHEDCVESVNHNESGLYSEESHSSSSTKDVDLKTESSTSGLTISSWETTHSHDNRTLALKHLDDVITQVLTERKENKEEQPNHSNSTGTLDQPTTTIPTVALPSNDSSHKLATVATCTYLCNQRADSKTNNNSTFQSPDNQDQFVGTSIKGTDWETPSTAPKSRNDVFWAYPIVLTTYEVAIRDSKFLQHVHFKGLIVDEGQRLKNPATRLYGKLSKLSTGLRLLVTGTPLQNRISELWALLHFILPEIFTSLEMFEASNWFDPAVLSEHAGRDRLVTAEVERSLITKLHCIISPFMLRRTKVETNLLLPPKREILLRVGMTALQQKLYTQALQICRTHHGSSTRSATFNQVVNHPANYRDKGGSLTWLDPANIIPDGEGKHQLSTTGFIRQSRLHQASGNSSLMGMQTRSRTQPYRLHHVHQSEPSALAEEKSPPIDFLISPQVSLNNGLMLLRRIANHPYLAIDRPDSENSERQVDCQPAQSTKLVDVGTPSERSADLINVVELSEKTRLLDRLLKHLIETKHKVLIFSQLTIILDIIEELLTARKWSFVRLDGSTKFTERQEAILRFSYEPVDRLPVFLVSARAGGCGLNLQAAADTVIIFDSDWNPQTDLQAQDRCHRIGQTQPVLVIRLVTADTVDEAILKHATVKRGLERLVMAHESLCPSKQHRRITPVDINDVMPVPNEPAQRQRHKHGWLTPRIRNQMNNADGTSGLALPKEELLQLLVQTDYHSDVSHVNQLSDEELFNLLDRTELYQLWEEQKAKIQSSNNNILKGTNNLADEHVDSQTLSIDIQLKNAPIDIVPVTLDKRKRCMQKLASSTINPSLFSPKRTRSNVIRTRIADSTSAERCKVDQIDQQECLVFTTEP